jgi:hypothetical protein
VRPCEDATRTSRFSRGRYGLQAAYSAMQPGSLDAGALLRGRSAALRRCRAAGHNSAARRRCIDGLCVLPAIPLFGAARVCAPTHCTTSGWSCVGGEGRPRQRLAVVSPAYLESSPSCRAAWFRCPATILARFVLESSGQGRVHRLVLQLQGLEWLRPTVPFEVAGRGAAGQVPATRARPD